MSGPRLSRWSVAAVAVTAGCSGYALDPIVHLDAGQPPPVSSLQFTESFPAPLPAQLDVLFVVDNSKEMEPFLGVLPDAVRAFVTKLRESPGGLPDLHAGVITTDMGTGAITSGVPGCSKYPAGDDGSFVVGPSLPFAWDATAGKWNPTPSVDCGLCGSFVAEPSGTAGPCPSVEDALACAVQVGNAGCVFEQPLAAARRALTRPDTGFLRPGAQLAIVVVTNEDDCSLRDSPPSEMLDPSQDDYFGPLTSYRCNRFGHLCDGLQPPQWRWEWTSWPYYPEHCVSNENGSLLRDLDVLVALQALKPAASLVSLSVIAGPTTTASGSSAYSVVLDSELAASLGHAGEEWPRVQPSCGTPTAGLGYPAVRLQQLTGMFGAHGHFAAICGGSLTTQLQEAAEAILATMTRYCLSSGGVFARVFEKLDAGGETLIPPCGDGTDAGSEICWRREDDPACKSGSRLVVPGALPPGTIFLR